MQTLFETAHAQGDAFSATQWSVILAAGESQADPENSRAALAALCQTYWPPLYTYARARGHSVPDAQDLTQVFSPTSSNIRSTSAPTGRKESFAPFSSPPSRTS